MLTSFLTSSTNAFTSQNWSRRLPLKESWTTKSSFGSNQHSVVKKQRMGWSFLPKAVFSGIHNTDKIVPQKDLPSSNTVIINPVLFISYRTFSLNLGTLSVASQLCGWLEAPEWVVWELLCLCPMSTCLKRLDASEVEVRTCYWFHCEWWVRWRWESGSKVLFLSDAGLSTWHFVGVA